MGCVYMGVVPTDDAVVGAIPDGTIFASKNRRAVAALYRVGLSTDDGGIVTRTNGVSLTAADGQTNAFPGHGEYFWFANGGGYWASTNHIALSSCDS